jgi:hypothetical protein
MPWYRPSATRWRWPVSSSRLSSLALLTKEISESTAGMLAQVKTMMGYYVRGIMQSIFWPEAGHLDEEIYSWAAVSKGFAQVLENVVKWGRQS